MARYVAKRLVLLLVIIFVVSVGTFYMVHLLPGNPAITILGPNATSANAAMRSNTNWDWTSPSWTSTSSGSATCSRAIWANRSPRTTPRRSILAQAYPIDLELIVISQIMALAIALPMAMTASRRPYRLFDQLSNGTTFAMLAMPPFVIAPVLVLIFAVHWHVFPGPASYVPITQGFWSNIHTMLLPSIVLAIGLDRRLLPITSERPHFHPQRGLHHHGALQGPVDRRIMWRHALRPSSISLLASAGVTIAGLIAGTLVVEELLQLPGIGYQLIWSVYPDDYTVVQGIALVVAVAIVLINFVFDFLFTSSTRGSPVLAPTAEHRRNCRIKGRSPPKKRTIRKEEARPLLLVMLGWVVLVTVLAIFANLFPLPVRTLATISARRMAGPGGVTSWERTTSIATS